MITTAAFAAPAFAGDPMLSSGGYEGQMHTTPMMKMLDPDGNRMVSNAEFDDFYGKLFDELDTDKDGEVDATEWVGVKGRTKLELATGGYNRELRTMKMLGMMDKDADHKVAKDDFFTHHKTIFTAMEKSGDGEINPQEWLGKHAGN
ncbi:MAG: calcium-binding protein [Methylophilaceae bacterium]|nr:calcium-binding protein [Methylophilaceae bacterium]